MRRQAEEARSRAEEEAASEAAGRRRAEAEQLSCFSQEAYCIQRALLFVRSLCGHHYIGCENT